MNYYDLLEVSPKASQEVIKMAYKALIKKYHPDTYQGDKGFAESHTKEIIEAYEGLSNPISKRAYDIKHGFAATNNGTNHKQDCSSTINDNRTREDAHDTHQREKRDSMNQSVTYDCEFAPKDTQQSKNRVGIHFRIVMIGLIIGCLIIAMVVIGKNYAIQLSQAEEEYLSYVNKGDKFFFDNKYNLAATSYQSALNIRQDENLRKQYELAIALEQSNRYFLLAEASYNRGEYEKSLQNYQKVIPRDINYFESQNRINEIIEFLDDLPSIQLGTTKSDVKNILGSPNKIEDYSSFSYWYYGTGFNASEISFDERGRVTGWDEKDVKLRVFLGNPKPNAKPFELGSTYEDVVNAMGTPNRIDHYSSFSYWYYGTSFNASEVSFDERGRVTGWDERDVQLKLP